MSFKRLYAIFLCLFFTTLCGCQNKSNQPLIGLSMDTLRGPAGPRTATCS